jgi:hypothetical protein
MKKFFAVLTIAGALLFAPLHGDGIPYYPDWVWTGTYWQYTGTENPPPLGV